MAEKILTAEKKINTGLIYEDAAPEIDRTQSPQLRAEIYQQCFQLVRGKLEFAKSHVSPKEYEDYVADRLRTFISLENNHQNAEWREFFGLDMSFFDPEAGVHNLRRVELGQQLTINILFDDALADLVPRKVIQSVVEEYLALPNHGTAQNVFDLLNVSAPFWRMQFEANQHDTDQPYLVPPKALNQLNYGLISWLMNNYELAIPEIMRGSTAHPESAIILAKLYGFLDGNDKDTIKRRMLFNFFDNTRDERIKSYFLDYDAEAFKPPDSVRLQILKKLHAKIEAYLKIHTKAANTSTIDKEKINMIASRVDTPGAYGSLKATDEGEVNSLQAKDLQARADVQKDLEFLYQKYAGIEYSTARQILKQKLPALLGRVARDINRRGHDGENQLSLQAILRRFKYALAETPLEDLPFDEYRNWHETGFLLIETLDLIKLDSNVTGEYRMMIDRILQIAEPYRWDLARRHDGEEKPDRLHWKGAEAIKWEAYDDEQEQAKDRLIGMDETSPMVSTEDYLVATELQDRMQEWRNFMRLVKAQYKKDIFEVKVVSRESLDIEDNQGIKFVFTDVIPAGLGLTVEAMIQRPDIASYLFAFLVVLGIFEIVGIVYQNNVGSRGKISRDLFPKIRKLHTSILEAQFKPAIDEIFDQHLQSQKEYKDINWEKISVFLLIFFLTMGITDAFINSGASLDLAANTGGNGYASNILPSDSEFESNNPMAMELLYTGPAHLEYAGGPKCWPAQGANQFACSNKETFEQFQFGQDQIESFSNLQDFKQAVEQVDTTKYAVELKTVNQNFYEIIDQTRPVKVLVENPSPDFALEWHPLTGAYITGTFTRVALVSEVLPVANQLADPPQEVPTGYFGAISPEDEKTYPELQKLDGLRDSIRQALEIQQAHIAGMTPEQITAAMQQPADQRGWYTNREILLGILGSLSQLGYNYGHSNFSSQPRPYAELLRDQLNDPNWECEMFATGEVLLTRWAQRDKYLGFTTYERIGFVLNSGSPSWQGDKGHAAVDYTDVDGHWYSFTPDELTGNAAASTGQPAEAPQDYFAMAEAQGDEVTTITRELEQHAFLISEIGAAGIALTLALQKLRKSKISLPKVSSFGRIGARPKSEQVNSSVDLKRDNSPAAIDESYDSLDELDNLGGNTLDVEAVSSDESAAASEPQEPELPPPPNLHELTQAVAQAHYEVLFPVFETLNNLFDLQGNHNRNRFLDTDLLNEEEQAHHFADQLIRKLRKIGKEGGTGKADYLSETRQRHLTSSIRRQFIDQGLSAQIVVAPPDLIAAFGPDPAKVASIIEGREAAILQGLQIVRDRLALESDTLKLSDPAQTISFAEAFAGVDQVQFQIRNLDQVLAIIDHLLGN